MSPKHWFTRSNDPSQSSGLAPVRSLLPAAGVALALVICATVAPPAGAQEDPRLEARLLVMDGKFGEADEILAKAPEDVRKDPNLFRKLGSLALRATKAEDGEARRPGLVAAKSFYARSMDLDASNADSAAGALESAMTLAQLETEANHPVKASEYVSWAIASGEMALKAGAASASLKGSIADAFAMRGATYKKYEEIKDLCSDYQRAGDLFAEAAAEAPEDAHVLFSAAANARLAEAKFVHDRVPSKKEKRDDKALEAAAAYAAQACDLPDAKDDAYFTHLSVLRLAVEWEVDGDFGEPYMQPLSPPMPGLEMLIPKSQGWKRSRDAEWDVILTRHFEFADEHNQCQIKVKIYPWEGEQKFGVSWRDIETICKRYYNSGVQDYTELKRNVEPVDLASLKPPKGSKKKKKKTKKKKKGKKKKDVEVWHFRIAGQRTAADGRQQQRAEFIFHAPEAQETYLIRVLDWDMPWGLDDPDVSKVIESACGFPVPPKDTGAKKKK